ncbi:MAG: hydroxyquinol 1,2-dioxygenase [Gammaproteobacteria bacterium]|nr:hydroxyquinol 1,2-dioxygenase [Gammaproteobacteria bacterium]
MVGDLSDVRAMEQDFPSTRNESGYQRFRLGDFVFSRDEYFVHIEWRAQGKKLSHTMSADVFLRALMRDVAWNFFYGWVNFDDVFGTRNRYDRVELYAGRYHPVYKEQGLDHSACFDSSFVMQAFRSMLDDWTNVGYDPFAAPAETGLTWQGKKQGHNRAALNRARESCRRMPGLPGDVPLRTDRNRYPINRAFLDVPQDEPVIEAEPGFEHEVHAFNLFAYLSRSDVTWNPSVTSVCKHSLFCPTTEEYILPVKHANDRIEWFLQLSDQIEWRIEDRATGRPRASVVMRAGDVAAMPADIRHQGFSRRRSMLLVWENADPRLPQLYEDGILPPSLAGEFQEPGSVK